MSTDDTRDWRNATITGLSTIGQMGTGPDPDETVLLLKRVRDGLLGQPAESSSNGEDVAA